MNTTRMMVLAMLITGSGLTALVTNAQQPGITRSDIVRHDLGVAGREVIQVRVDFAQRVAFGSTRIPAQRSPTSSKARWSISSRASRR
jgi:hypothetical protein